MSTTDPFEMRPEDLKVISKLSGNNKCIDCGDNNTEWGSVSFGILFCAPCSGDHRYAPLLFVIMNSFVVCLLVSWVKILRWFLCCLCALLCAGGTELIEYYNHNSPKNTRLIRVLFVGFWSLCSYTITEVWEPIFLVSVVSRWIRGNLLTLSVWNTVVISSVVTFWKHMELILTILQYDSDTIARQRNCTNKYWAPVSL